MVQPVSDGTFVALIWTSLSIGTFMLIILLVFSIKNLYCIPDKCNHNVIKSNKLLKLLLIFHILGYILCNITWMIWWHILLNEVTMDADRRSALLETFNTLSIIFWSFASLSFLSLLLLRLHSIFHGSEYQLPNCAFIIWFTLLIFIFISYIFFIIDIFGKLDADVFNNIVFPCLVILNIITGLTLLYAFGSRLFTLAVKMSLNKIDAHIPNKSAVDIKSESYQWIEYEAVLDCQQINLLKVISKNTLLGGIAILVIQIYLCFQSVERMIDHHYGWNVWSYYLCTRWILRSMVMLIETFCVYLSFAVNRKLFESICGKCQNRLQLLCQVKIKKKIDRHKSYEMCLLASA